MPDDLNDNVDIDIEVDNVDVDMPDDATDTPADDDDDFSFDGLTDEEIAAINSTDDADDEDGDSDEEDTTGDDDDGDNEDADVDEDSANDDTTQPATDTSEFEQEAASLAQRRSDIDAKYDDALARHKALGEKLDNGDIYEGAYNSERLSIEREIKRLEASEADLVTKEESVNSRQASAAEADQQAFVAAGQAFMLRPENSVFTEGSAEYNALDQMMSAVGASLPADTPYEVVFDKARTAVASYMTLPEITDKTKPKAVKPEDKIMPSISGMPSVVANSTDAGKFAHLDKLSGQDYESALDAMTDEQQRAYLHG